MTAEAPRVTDLIDLTPGRDTGWVWLHSDLQLTEPDLAGRVLAAAVDDIASLDETIDVACCLGDALVGHNVGDLERVATTCIELLEPLDVPICYVLGNHEMDLRREGTPRFPLYEQVVNRRGWHTTAALDEPWFERRCLGGRWLFFGDHADPATSPASPGKWWTSHHRIEHGDEHYPHGKAWRALRQTLAGASPAEPIIFAGHSAMPGGQRPSKLMKHLMPVPHAVRLHMHGHAHIGDMTWIPRNPWQRKHAVAGQTLHQYNISALENDRTPGSHSALLRIERGEPTALRIRCHMERRWIDAFDLQQVRV